MALLLAVGCAGAQKPFHPQAVAFQAEGARAFARGDLDRSAGLFSLALEYEPRMAVARNGLGLVAFARGDKATAETEIRAALSLNEELAEAHLNLGFLLLDKEDVEDALDRFRRALAIDPGFGGARLAAGETLLRLGRYEAARWELAKLCEVEPQRAAAHAAHALILARMGRIAAAEHAARRALELDAELPAAHRARAEILRRSGDPGGAIIELRRVLASMPGSVEDRLVLVVSLAGAGKDDDAAAEVARLELLVPRRAEVSFARGYVELRLGHHDVAIAAARRALTLRSRYPEARMVLAEALLRQGSEEEGRKELVAFVAEAPEGMGEEKGAAERYLRGEGR